MEEPEYWESLRLVLDLHQEWGVKGSKLDGKGKSEDEQGGLEFRIGWVGEAGGIRRGGELKYRRQKRNKWRA